MKITNLTSTWPLLSWDSAASSSASVIAFDVTGHIQAIVNDGRR